MLNNQTGIPLSIAVWLATDNYNHNVDPNYISATGLLKPIKSIILSRQMLQQAIAGDQDIADLVPSKMGTAVHDGIEEAWRNNYKMALKHLGYGDELINKVRINPTSDEEDIIPVYLEQRGFKKVGNWEIGGKFDFVADGKLTDFKTTKTYSWIAGSNNEDYIRQGSIYRWLMPEIITKDIMSIGFIFTDWIKMKSIQDRAYPQVPVIEKDYPLMDLDSTENFIKGILNNIDTYQHKDQDDIPPCTKEELWQNDSVWKYFKDPAKRTRSTKNFDNPTDANLRMGNDGGMGIVVEVPGEVKRCRYCNGRPICKQATALEATGLLKP